MHHPSPYIWNVAFCFSGGVFFGRRQFSTLVAKFLATMESGTFFVHQVDLGISRQVLEVQSSWQAKCFVGADFVAGAPLVDLEE